MAKVIHVHLIHGLKETKRKDWYFSSISAVYTVFTPEQVGATRNLRSFRVVLGQRIKTKKEKA